MVIKAGLSHNLCPEGYRYFYDPAMLQVAMPLFDGVPAYAFEFSPEYFDHVPDDAIPPRTSAFAFRVSPFHIPHRILILEGEFIPTP